jgi:hypothetical protein
LLLGTLSLFGRSSSPGRSRQVLFDEFELVRPGKIAITLGTQGSITFDLRGRAVTAISIQLGSSHYSVPEAECQKLHDIDFGSTGLEWDPESNHAAHAAFFAIYFTFGTEPDKSFGELPRAMLYFDDHKFTSVVIRRKTSENSWIDGDH